MSIRIEIASLRFEHIIATYQYATTRVTTNVSLCIKQEVVGVERCIAIDNLNNIGVDSRLVNIAIVLGSVAVDVGRTAIYQHIAKALDMSLGVAHSTICRNDSTIVVCSKIANHNHYLLAVMLRLPTLVGLHLDIVALLLSVVGD